MVLNPSTVCRRSLPALLLVLMAGIAVYANTFHVPFLLDDVSSIAKNPVIKSLENYKFSGSGYEFVPNRVVGFLTFALNYHFGGLEVSGFHAVNLSIHLLTALLVYFLLRLTFRIPFLKAQIKDSDQKAGPHLSLQPAAFIPLFAALLFVVHPVQTQAVTYIVQRLTSLATLFYLLSLVLYVKARLRVEQNSEIRIQNSESKTSQQARVQPVPQSQPSSLPVLLLFAGSVLAAILAMKTKEIAFTLPLAIVLYEACFFRGSWKQRFLYLLPLLATLPIIPITVLSVGESASDLLSDSGEQLRVQSNLSRPDYLFTQFRVIVTYLRLLIVPMNQNLDYDYPVYSNFFSPPVFLSFSLLAAILGTALYLFRSSRLVTKEDPIAAEATSSQKTGQAKDSPEPGLTENRKKAICLRLIAFGIVWFFLTLAVESSFIPIVDVIMEHRLYLPSVGAFVAFASFFCLLGRKLSRPAFEKWAIAGALLLVTVLGLATCQRNQVWGNPVRLWEDVVAKSPRKGRPLNNLGVALEEAGRRSEAFGVLSRAISIDPDYYRSYYNLAELYLVSDQPEAAMPLLQNAIWRRADFTEAYVKMGAALMRAGRFDEVILFLEENFERIENQAEARFYLGAAYAFIGKRQDALRELAVVSRLDDKLAGSLKGLLGLGSGHGHSGGGG